MPSPIEAGGCRIPTPTTMSRSIGARQRPTEMLEEPWWMCNGDDVGLMLS